MNSLIIMGSGNGYSKVNELIKKWGCGYEIWGCATNLFHKNMPKLDLIFEIHKYDNELEYIYKKMKENKDLNYMDVKCV